jgi:hypothetical protein
MEALVVVDGLMRLRSNYSATISMLSTIQEPLFSVIAPAFAPGAKIEYNPQASRMIVCVDLKEEVDARLSCTSVSEMR